MKKTYIIPDMTIVKIKTSNHLMEASQMGYQGDLDSGITIASREDGWWDDDTEEDDFYADRY